MKKLSKILACLLVAVLMLTGVVLVAAAEGEALEATTADGITVTKHNDLAEAITAAGEGGTVKLLANYSATANVALTADLTIDLGDGKKLDMGGFTLSVSGGAEVTVKNGLVTSAESNNNSGYYVIDVSGSDTTLNFDKVRVVNSADLFKVSDHATVNVSGTWDNTRWEAKRCNFNITDASVNLDGVNIYCQDNNMIVIKGKDSRLTINNSNIETGKRTIELTAGYAADGVNSAMAEGEYHVKVTNSTLKSPTYAVLLSSPYLTSVKDSSYLYWNIEGTTAYHWEEVTLAEGTDASAWLNELAALTLTHDSRDAGKKQIVTPRKTEGGKYYELKEGLPYHHSEVLFENSHLVTTGAKAFIMEVSHLSPQSTDGAYKIRNQHIYSERHSMSNVEFNGCLVEAPKNAYQAFTSFTTVRNTVTVFTGVGANKDSAGIFSNGMFVSYDSVFLYPIKEPASNTDYHRMFSSGLGNINFGLHNTYFSDYSNASNVSLQKYMNALNLYGNTGYVLDVGDAAPDLDKINAALAAVNTKWGTSYKLPAQSESFVQDFSTVLGYGDNDNWIVPGIKVTGAATSVNKALRIAATEGVQSALYFGHYNTGYDLTNLLGAAANYKNNAFEKLGYADKATALDDLSLIGVYAVDFDITSNFETALGLVAENNTVAATLTLPAFTAGAHVSLLVKVDTGVGRLYIDGELVSESDALLGSATALRGVKLAMTEGTALVDNIQIRQFDKSYTDADLLFTTDADLLEWSEGYCAAKIGEKRYASLTKAVADAQAGETVEVVRETNAIVLAIKAPITVKFGSFEISYTSDNYIAVPSEDGESITFAVPNPNSYTTIIWHDSVTNPTTKYYQLGATPTYNGPVLKQYINNEGVVVKFAGWATTPDADKTMAVNEFSYIKATDLDGVINYYPVYYNDPIYCVEQNGVKISEGYTWAELLAAFNAAQNDYVIKLLNDINVPTPDALKGQPTLKFPANKTVGFDFNGYKMIRDFGPARDNEGNITGTRKGEGFNSNSGAHCYIFSSRPGGEFYGHGIFLQTTYANSYVYVGSGLNGEDYGDNLSVFSAVGYNAKGGTQLYINGTYFILQGGYRALNMNEGSAVVVAEGTVFTHGSSTPFLYAAGTVKDTSLSATFINCSFVGNGNQNLFLQCRESEKSDGSTAKTRFVFDKCAFYNLKMAVTQEAVTAETVFTEGCTFKGLWEVSSGTALALPTSSRVYAKQNYTPKQLQLGVTPYNTSPYLTFKYDENGNIIRNNNLFTLAPDEVLVNPENACKVTWVAGDLTLTEYWVKGETPVCTNDSVLLQLAMLSRPGGYKFDFVIDGAVNEDTTYTAVYVPDFDMRANLTIGESLNLNVYIPAGAGVYTATLNGIDFEIKADKYPTRTIDGQVYYVLTLKNIKPQDLVSKISLVASAKVIFTETDIKHEDIDKSFTLVDYVTEALADPNTSEKDKAILKALLAYVDAACVYFGNDEGADYEALHALSEANPAGEATGAAVGDMSAVKSAVSGAALNLKGMPAIRFYVSDATTPIVFSYVRYGAATTMTVTEADLKTDKDGKHYVEITLPMHEIAGTVTVKVGEAVGTYNLSTYKASGVVSANSELAALVEALIRYSSAAAN